MKINIVFDSTLSSASPEYKAAVLAAAAEFDSAVLNPITVSVTVGLGSGITAPNAQYFGGASVLSALSGALAASNTLASLPVAGSVQAQWVPLAEAQALGLAPLHAGGSAGSFMLGPWNADTTATGGFAIQSVEQGSLFSIATLLGAQGSLYGPESFYTYSAPGQLWNPASTVDPYFSMDGGKTNLAALSAAYDGALNVGTPDPLSVSGSVSDTLTPLDNTVLQSLGFAVATNNITLAANTSAHVASSTAYTGTSSDTVAFSGTENQYHIDTTTVPGMTTVQDTVALRDGASGFTGVGRLQFADQTLAFDTGSNQSTGKAAELLGATFGHTAVSDAVAMGDWVSFFDHGGTMAQAAQDMIASGTLPTSNSAFVSAVWQNVVGSAIDPTDLNTFTTDLANGTFTLSSLLTLAAETATNQTTQGLTTLAQNGVSFTPLTTTGSVNTTTYTNPASDYTVADNAGTLTVSGMGNTDVLTNVQRVKFSDGSIAFDLGANQSGGEAALLLSAAQGAGGLTAKTALGTVITALDGGATLTTAAQNLLTSGAVSFASNTAMVTQVWQNVVGTPIDSADLALFTTDLSNGTFTQASLLALAAETTQNQHTVNLVGLQTHGLAFA